MSSDNQARGPFQQLFLKRLDTIEARAKAAGSTITHLCRESGIARATPDRWRVRPPKSVELMDQLEAALVAVEQKAAEARA